MRHLPQMKCHYLFLRISNHVTPLKFGRLVKKMRDILRDLPMGEFIAFYSLHSENSTLWLKINETRLRFKNKHSFTFALMLLDKDVCSFSFNNSLSYDWYLRKCCITNTRWVTGLSMISEYKPVKTLPVKLQAIAILTTEDDERNALF